MAWQSTWLSGLKSTINWVSGSLLALYVLFPVQLEVLLTDMSEMYYGLSS